jgi:hypothetical protein
LLRNFLILHLEKEIKNHNTNFNGLQLFNLINETDENPVLRIILSYKKLVNIDRFLEHILVEYKFYDLFPTFLGELKTNINLRNVLHANLVNLNDTISMEVRRYLCYIVCLSALHFVG